MHHLDSLVPCSYLVDSETGVSVFDVMLDLSLEHVVTFVSILEFEIDQGSTLLVEAY